MVREASTLSLVTCHAGFSRRGIDPVGETTSFPITLLARGALSFYHTYARSGEIPCLSLTKNRRSHASPLAWKMPQRNECFSFSPAVLEQVALHLGVAAVVTALVAEATAHLSGGMPLFWRRGLVVSKDLVNDCKGRSQERSDSVPHLWNRIGPGVRQYLADCVVRVFKLTSDQFDREPLAMGSADVTIIVHRKHSFASMHSERSLTKRSLYRRRLRGSFLDDQTARKGVSSRRSLPGGSGPAASSWLT